MSGGCRLVYDMDKILEWGKKILPSPAVLFFAHIVSISNCLFAVIWLFWLICVRTKICDFRLGPVFHFLTIQYSKCFWNSFRHHEKLFKIVHVVSDVLFIKSYL